MNIRLTLCVWKRSIRKETQLKPFLHIYSAYICLKLSVLLCLMTVLAAFTGNKLPDSYPAHVSYFMQMQRELNSRRGEGSDVKDGSTSYRGMFSPQDSPCQAPRSPHTPRSPCTATPVLMPPTRSHSDSEAILEEQGAAMGLKGSADNLFLDALSLDPMSGPEVPPPSRLESEKRFPCMKEVTHIWVQYDLWRDKGKCVHVCDSYTMWKNIFLRFWAVTNENSS